MEKKYEEKRLELERSVLRLHTQQYYVTLIFSTILISAITIYANYSNNEKQLASSKEIAHLQQQIELIKLGLMVDNWLSEQTTFYFLNDSIFFCI